MANHRELTTSLFELILKNLKTEHLPSTDLPTLPREAFMDVCNNLLLNETKINLTTFKVLIKIMDEQYQAYDLMYHAVIRACTNPHIIFYRGEEVVRL